MITPMNAVEPRPAATKRAQAQAEFAKLLDAAATRGFHGTATLTVSVQDGHIQHLRATVERMIR
jgi:hypothetical protein